MSSTPTAFIPSFGNDSPTCIPTRRLSRAACPNTAQCGYYWLFRTNLSFSARFPPLLWLASPFSHLLRFKMFASSSVVPSHTIPHLSYFLNSFSFSFSSFFFSPLDSAHFRNPCHSPRLGVYVLPVSPLPISPSFCFCDFWPNQSLLKNFSTTLIPRNQSPSSLKATQGCPKGGLHSGPPAIVCC